MIIPDKDNIIISKSPKETLALAQKISRKLEGGEVIALNGELGSGKTTFIKGLAKSSAVKEEITSPTFVVLKSYQGKIKDKEIVLVHIDAYRINNIDDIKSVGIEDYLERNDVVMVVEWAERIKEILPADLYQINFKFIDENTREISYDFNN